MLVKVLSFIGIAVITFFASFILLVIVAILAHREDCSAEYNFSIFLQICVASFACVRLNIFDDLVTNISATVAILIIFNLILKPVVKFLIKKIDDDIKTKTELIPYSNIACMLINGVIIAIAVPTIYFIIK